MSSPVCACRPNILATGLDSPESMHARPMCAAPFCQRDRLPGLQLLAAPGEATPGRSCGSLAAASASETRAMFCSSTSSKSTSATPAAHGMVTMCFCFFFVRSLLLPGSAALLLLLPRSPASCIAPARALYASRSSRASSVSKYCMSGRQPTALRGSGEARAPAVRPGAAVLLAWRRLASFFPGRTSVTWGRCSGFMWFWIRWQVRRAVLVVQVSSWQDQGDYKIGTYGLHVYFSLPRLRPLARSTRTRRSQRPGGRARPARRGAACGSLPARRCTAGHGRCAVC